MTSLLLFGLGLSLILVPVAKADEAPGQGVSSAPRIIYPVIKGTNTPDYGSDARLIERRGIVYPVIPGTNTPDYGKPIAIVKEAQ
ncbi:MAG: hypothetical protein EOM24_33440 [Chloroflexia bacterium]|nr:hypothetical protein [Chloroflexia bacterium]